MRDRRRRASEVYVVRNRGMDERHRAAMNKRFRDADDLFTVCPACGLRRTGRMEEVTAPCPQCRSDASGDDKESN